MKDEDTSKTTFLSEIVDAYNARMKHDAMEAYLNGDAHLLFLIAGQFTALCRKSAERLGAGEIDPFLDVGCDEERFCELLSVSVEILYRNYRLPVDYDSKEENPPPFDEILSEADRACLTGDLADDELCERLESHHDCLPVRHIHTHLEDERTQRAYYGAVLDHFRSAAAYARKIGSESARMWLDALRLVQPQKAPLLGEAAGRSKLGVSAAQAKAAYARAKEAQGRLWVDVQFAALEGR